MTKKEPQKTELQLLVEINNKLDNIEHLKKMKKNKSYCFFNSKVWPNFYTWD
jgi:hypothetical protein